MANNKKTKAFVIGRFQPFHKGHLELFKFIDGMKFVDEIIIGIGSSNKNGVRNPWNSLQVMAMISSSLCDVMKIHKISCIPIPDIGNLREYANHVESLTGIKEDDTVIFTGNSITKHCFKNKNYNKNYTIVDVRNHGLDEEGGISGTMIREKIINNELWETLVPAGVVDVIQRGDLPSCLQGRMHIS